jgi:hypothetical protein
MISSPDNLGTCPACNTPLIKNRRDQREAFHVALTGEDPPAKAYYPNFYHEIDAVWCPGCGLAKQVSFPRMEVSFTNPEFIGWIRKNAAN